KLEAVLRLLLSVFVCFFAGALLLSALHRAGAGGKVSLRFCLLAGGAIGFLGATPKLLRGPWAQENFMRHLVVLLACFWIGLFLGGWALKVTGPVPAGMSAGQMLIATCSFQGATLVLLPRFLREHQTSWAEAFGLSNRWRHALLHGVIIACLFLPIGWG